MTKLSRIGLVALALTAFAVRPLAAEDCTPGPIGAAGPWIDGSVQACSDFRVLLLDLGLFQIDFDSTDEGWVWANLSHAGTRYQSVSGLCEKSNVAYNDNTANHDSHDQGTDVKVDPQYLPLLSNVNGPNNEDLVDSVADFCDPVSIELEWEVGTFPDEVGRSVLQRTFPQWAWPNVGDRVWADGNWIFDCGHAKDVCLYRDPATHFCVLKQDYYHSEIHPPRAVASMRNQAATLPGTGTTPVPVTATDLYVHGRAGMVGDVLQCGMPVVLGEGSCDVSSYPHRGTPINEDFEFDICLPPRPREDARLEWAVALGPGNSVPETDELRVDITEGGHLEVCQANAGAPMDTQKTLHVKVPLGGKNVGPDEVYARRITAGWVEPPDPTLKHLAVSLDRIDMHDSSDESSLINPICNDDGELTFFWASLDAAPSNEWIRLADHAPVFSNGHSVMNDFDGELLGHSYVGFDGAGWDFYVRQGQPLRFRTTGFEQDCYDNYFGDHGLNVATPYVYCNVSPTICRDGNNDNLAKVDDEVDYGSIDPDTGEVVLHPSSPPELRIIGFDPPDIRFIPDYEFDMTVRLVPLGLEDTADLSITKTCTPDSGLSFVCLLRVSNLGPGLPKNVVVDDVVTASRGGSFTLGTPSASRSDGSTFATNPCSIAAADRISCAIGTVPVGGSVTVSVRIVSNALGDYDDVATVTTDSTDSVSANDRATGGWTVVPIDIRPGATPNAINVNDSGAVAVAILLASGFNPVVVDFTTVCFGDAEDPAARTCVEIHNTGHRQDADKDRDIDLLLHYEVRRTGIDAGDTSACLTGSTFAGRTIVGCDSVKTK